MIVVATGRPPPGGCSKRAEAIVGVTHESLLTLQAAHCMPQVCQLIHDSTRLASCDSLPRRSIIIR